MATITWTGAAHDGLFSDPGNWAGNILPGTADVAVIAPGTATTVTSGTAGSPSVSAFALNANVTLAINAFTSFTTTKGTTGAGIAGTINISNGGVLNLFGASTNSGTINIANAAVLSLAGTIANSGVINEQGSGSTTEIALSGNATLTGGGRVVLSGSANNFILGNQSTFTLTNLNNIISGGGTIGNNEMTLVNAGTINANDSGVLLVVNPNNGTTNSGIMEATSGGTLQLLNDPVANFSGVTGGTVEAVGAGSVLVLQASVLGGTVTAAGGGTVESNGGALDGLPLHPVTVSAPIQILNGQSLFLAGTIINNSSINLSSTGSNTFLRNASPVVTLKGAGTISLGANANNIIEGTQQYFELINQSNTIQGAGQIGDEFLTLVNQAAGVINASTTSTLTLDTVGEILLNQGLIEATSTGGLLVKNTLIENAGTGTVRASGASSQVQLQSSAIQGGTLSTTSGGVFVTTDRFSELDGFSGGTLTNQGTVSVADNTSLKLAGTINNIGTISVASTNDVTQLLVNGYSAALRGGGKVVLSNNGNNLIQAGFPGFQLTNFDNTISGSGNIGNGGNNPFFLVNKATINANQATALTISEGAQFATNTGTMEATAGGSLLFASTIVDNAGGTILASGASSHVHLQASDIQGGTLATASGGVIDTTDRNSTLDGLTQGAVNNKGTISINDSTSLAIVGTINNSGLIALASVSNVTQLLVNGPTVTLTGGGQVALSAASANNIIQGGNSAFRLFNLNNTISGAGNIGNGGNNPFFLVNQATINANQSGALTINTGSDLFTNAGTLEATGAGGLSIVSTAVNNAGGTILASGTNDHVNLQGADIEGGVLKTTSGGLIATIGNSSAIDGVTVGAVTIAAGSTVDIADNTSLTFAGSIANSGTILVNSAGSNSQFIVGNPLVTLKGGGQVVMSNVGSNRIIGTSNQFQLVNVDNTISGGGNIGNSGNNPFFLVNQALINANQGATLTLATGPDIITNTGTIEATGTGDLAISSTVNNAVGASTGTILADGTAALLQLQGAYIEGGNLVTTNGGAITTSAASALDGVTTGMVNNKGTLNVNNNTNLSIVGVINNTGRIVLNSAGGNSDLILFGQSATLTGTGQVVMADVPNSARIVGNGVQHTLVNNGNTITGAGQIGTNNMDFINQSGTVQGTGSNPLIFDLGAGTGVNKSGAWIIAKGSSSLQLQNGIFSNAGVMQALGSTLVFQPGAIDANLVEGTLAGGNWRAIASGTLGAALQLTGGPITTDAAIMVLQGASTSIQGGNGTTFTPIEQSLTAIAAGGQLQLLSSRGYSTTLDLHDGGIVQLGNGTLAAHSLTVDAGARLFGSGTVSDAPVNNGTIEAQGGLLKLTGSVTGGGTLQIDNVSTLELGGSAGETVNFAVGATAGVLKIDTAASFSGNVTNVNLGDVIDLVNIAPASITSVSWKNQFPKLIVTAGSTITYPSVTGVAGVSPTLDHWAITSDGAGGTNLTLTSGASSSVITGAVTGGAGGGSGAITGGVNNDPSWIGGSGTNFDTPANWSPAIVPTATSDAVIGTGFSVLASSGSDTVDSISVGGGSTLSVAGPGNTAFRVNNGTGPAGISGTISVTDFNSLDLGGTIGNSGSILLSSTGHTTDLIFTQAVNFLTGGGKVILSNNPNNRIYSANGNSSFTLANVNNTISGAGQLGAAQLTFINSGTVTANQSNALVLDTSGGGGQPVTNTGLLQDTGTGGLRIVNTAVLNTGGTIQSSGTLSHVDLSVASIQGGTLNGLIETVGSPSSIDGVTGGMLTNKGTVLVNDLTQLFLHGTINNTGTILENQISTIGNTDIRLATQAVTLQGGGQLIMSNNGGNRLGASSNDNTLINVDNTIRGAGQIGAGQIGGQSMTLVNATGGTINADQNPTFLQSGQLTLDTGSGPPTVMLNAGTIEATAGGGLMIRDTVVNNTGGAFGTPGTIQAVGAAAAVSITGAVLEGGTLATAGGGAIQTINQGGLSDVGVLDGLDLGAITNAGTFLVNDQTTLSLMGVIDNTGTIAVDQESAGGNTAIRLDSQFVTLTGAGTVQLSSIFGAAVFGHATTQTLINADNKILGSGQIGADFMVFTNQAAGIVDANQTTPLTLDTSGVTTNAGLLEATGGGTLVLSGVTIANAGGTVASSGAGSAVALQGGGPGLLLEGGTIAVNSVVQAQDRSVTLDGLSDGALANKGLVQVANGGRMFLNGAITNTGTIQLAGSGFAPANPTDLVIGLTATLSGGGSVVMSVGKSPGNDRIYANSSAVPYQLINVDNRITGAGQIGIPGNSLNVTNEAAGVINANGTGALVVSVQGANSVFNLGKMEATSTAALNGGLVLSNANVDNAGGTIMAVGSGGANAFAHVDLANAYIQAGLLTSSGGAIIQTAVGTTSNFLDGASVGALNTSGTLVVNDDSRLQLAGTIRNTGTLLQSAFSSNAFTDVEVVPAPGQSVGLATLTGAGQWIMSDNPNNRVYGAANASGLINNGNTIKAAGSLGINNNFSFTNTLGTLNAFGANPLIITPGAGFVTNNALLTATGTGGMVMADGLYINNGTMLAGDGSAITFQTAAVNTNLNEGVLAGGTWEAIATGHGATLSMDGGAPNGQGGPITVDAAVLILSGAGSVIQSGSGSGATPYTPIEQSLTSIAAGGQLQLLANRNYTTPLVLDSFGTIQLGGGTLQAGISTLEVPGSITGFGTVNGGIVNQGTILAKGGTLSFPHVIGASGINNGTLESNAGAVLSLGGSSAGAGAVINNGSLFISAVTTLSVLTSFSGVGAVTDNGVISMASGRNFSDTGAVTVVGKLQLAGGTLAAGTLTISPAGTLSGFGAVTSAVANAGKVDASGGTLTLSANVTGAGSLRAEPAATLVLGGAGNTAGGAVNNGTIAINPAKVLTLNGNATGSGAYVVNSTATLALKGTSSTSGAITDNGVVNIGASGSLTVTGSVNAASTGMFVLTNASLLEVAADTGASNQMSFLGASGDTLVVDAVANFGSNVGSSSYTGPLLKGFDNTIDKVDLKNLVFATATIDSYTAGTELLQLHSGSTKATLLFNNSDLGAGSFHIAADSGAGTVITHS